jgi:hypothetical protein
VGEGADGQEVDPGLGHRPGPFQGDATRRLGTGPPAAGLHRLGHRAQLHVVEQQQVAAEVEGLGDLVEGLHLDLEGQAGAGRPRRLDGPAQAARRLDVVVLDQQGVV